MWKREVPVVSVSEVFVSVWGGKGAGGISARFHRECTAEGASNGSEEGPDFVGARVRRSVTVEWLQGAKINRGGISELRHEFSRRLSLEYHR